MPIQRLRDTLVPRALAPLLPGVVWRGPECGGGRPFLYITVDDGPDPEGTPRWLDTLAQHDAKALFFLTGARAKRHPDLVQQIAEAGHRIGSHGFDHRSAWRTRPRTVEADAERSIGLLSSIAGREIVDYRPPYGRLTPNLARWAHRSGRRLVLWDLMPGDYLPARPPSRLAAEVVRLARPGSVVVLHDGAPVARAVAAIDLSLPRLAAAGWRFPALPPPR